MAEQRLRERIARDTQVSREVERLRTRHMAKTLFDQELSSEQTPTLEMFTLADYQNKPTFTAPSDLIDGVMKDNSVTLMLGPSGSGKSTLAMQTIHSLSTGQDWLGQTAKPLSGGFGVISYDMDAAMLGAMLVKYPGIDMSKVSLVNAYKQGNPLHVPHFRAGIIAAWKAMHVEVVVIDSFSASFFGENQNDAAATMAHYRDLRQFALAEVGARALIVIVHSTEASPYKIRGSTVHHDVADSIIGTAKIDPDKDPRLVKMVKYRAAPGQKEMSPVVVGAPDNVTHLVGLDLGAMVMQGLSLPTSAGSSSMVFPDLPEAIEEPDIESTEEDDL